MKVLVVKFNAFYTKVNLNVYWERKMTYCMLLVMLEGGVVS